MNERNAIDIIVAENGRDASFLTGGMVVGKERIVQTLVIARKRNIHNVVGIGAGDGRLAAEENNKKDNDKGEAEKNRDNREDVAPLGVFLLRRSGGCGRFWGF